MKKFDISSIPRISLCVLPTPIVKLARLSSMVGSNIYVKRDDLTGVAFGGNKNRKLEFLLADALAKKADVVITEGAIQSNHCLQTAVCASKAGLECELVLSGFKSSSITGNLFLDKIMDVKLNIVPETTDRKLKIEERTRSLERIGKRVYVIPTGGSTDIGSLGYINCVKEIQEYSTKNNISFDSIVIATGSGGTHAGLLLGCKFYYPDCDVVGITAADNKMEMENHVFQVINDFQKSYDILLDKNEIICTIYDSYFGEGYGIPSEEVIQTIKLVAKQEGFFLDPVYNGKAMVGLIDLLNKEILPKKGTYLFLHTGGGPTLFNFTDYFI